MKLVKLQNDVAMILLVLVQRLNYNWDDLKIAWLPGSLAGFMNIKNCEVLIVVDVFLDGFRSFLKLVKLYLNLAKLLLVSVQRLHYNWNDLNIV